LRAVFELIACFPLLALVLAQALPARAPMGSEQDGVAPVAGRALEAPLAPPAR